MKSGQGLTIVFIGLSITSSWGNGHATTYRALLKALARRGHRITFLERDVPWYADHRDLPVPRFCRTYLYGSLMELQKRFQSQIRDADLVVVGSYVPEGAAVGQWVLENAGGIKAFYDIDTPVTVAELSRGQCRYLNERLLARYDLYLSFTGGPFLEAMQKKFGIAAVMPLYCSADPTAYHPMDIQKRYDLGYMGTYSADRQPPLESLLVAPARAWKEGRFAVAGSMYPPELTWPSNVTVLEHIPPDAHCAFYNTQRFTLNVTRADMIAAGSSPSVRLFEAAASATPVISDHWEGMEDFFVPLEEILISHSKEETLYYLREMKEEQRRAVGLRARMRFLNQHTPDHRAAELEKKIIALQSSLPLEEPAEFAPLSHIKSL